MLCDLEQKLTQDYKNAVNGALKALGKENNLDIRVMHEDIFNSMHRI